MRSLIGSSYLTTEFSPCSATFGLPLAADLDPLALFDDGDLYFDHARLHLRIRFCHLFFHHDCANVVHQHLQTSGDDQLIHARYR